MRVIVIGHTGLIGQELLSQFKHHEKVKDVLCISRSGSCAKGVVNDGFVFLKADLSDSPSTIVSRLKWGEWEHSTLVILAWNGNMRSLSSYRDENKEIIRNASMVAKAAGVKQIVFVSSGGAVYSDGIGIREDSIIDVKTLSAYGVEKMWAEKYLIDFCAKESISLSVLRVATAYGKTASASQGVVAKWVRANHEEEEMELYNTLDSTINFIRIQDVAKAITEVIECSISGIFNVGSERSQSLQEVLEIIERVSGKPSCLKPSAMMTRRVFNMSSEKWKQQTGNRYDGVTDDAVRDIFKSLE